MPVNWTQERTDVAVDAFIEREGRIPKSKDFRVVNGLPSHGTMSNKFGGLTKYYVSRSIKPNYILFSKEEIINKVMEKAIILQRMPTLSEIQKYGIEDTLFPSDITIYKHFNSLVELAQEIGYTPNMVYFTKENVIIKIKEEADKLGRMLTIKEINKLSAENVSFPSLGPIYRHFKNLEVLAKEIRCLPNRGHFTKDMILEAVGKLASILGRLPTYDELNIYCKEDVYFPSASTVNKNFTGLKQLAEELRVPYFGDKGVSILEKEILSYIKELTKAKIIENDRKILGGKEIDILISSLGLGIEINGDYWHNDANKDKDYHIDKTTLAETKGLTLCHIFEYEWEYNNKETKQYLKDFISQKILELPKDKIVDRMKPLNYIGKIDKYSKPLLVNIGRYEVWNCGYIHYK